MEQQRINKFIAMSGLCSRREADRLIEEGRVEIDGKKAVPGDKVSGDEIITVSGERIGKRPDRVVYAYYKPRGVVCTHSDPHADTTVFDTVDLPRGVTYAGRLDKDSEGLLLLTNDGDLIQRMMKGSAGHEKEYLVSVDRPVTDEFLEKMQSGVYLKDLDRTTGKCKALRAGEKSFRIILTQGWNRQIRRMCAVLGYNVRSLKRTRVVSVTLDGLVKGQVRKLSKAEIEKLLEASGESIQVREITRGISEV